MLVTLLSRECPWRVYWSWILSLLLFTLVWRSSEKEYRPFAEADSIPRRRPSRAKLNRRGLRRHNPAWHPVPAESLPSLSLQLHVELEIRLDAPQAHPNSASRTTRVCAGPTRRPSSVQTIRGRDTFVTSVCLLTRTWPRRSAQGNPRPVQTLSERERSAPASVAQTASLFS